MIRHATRAADDYSEIARRQREIAAERGTACGCLKSLNVNGAVITTHVPGCQASNEACGCPSTLTGRGGEIKSHGRGCPLHPYAWSITRARAEACGCGTSPNVHGVEIKAHVPGCSLHPYYGDAGEGKGQ